MPATPRTRPRLRFALAPAVLLAAALALTARGQPVDPKKPAAPKELPAVKLPDGTFLWLGTPADPAGERVTLTPAELQKLLDQVEQLKKQLAARRAAPPSGCAVRARVEKRGDQLVAVLKLTCTFRTTVPQSAVLLGGKRAFLVAAALDGNKLPALDTTEDGLAALVESAGDHTLTLDLEAPVTARGIKPELGFEVGLPRAAMTTLLLDPPAGNVKAVTLTTRTPDPTQLAKPPEVRRQSAVGLKEFAPRPGAEAGYPLGPVDSVEVTWDAPTAAAQPADQVQSADFDLAVLFTEGVVETTAKIKLRGPAREWRLVAPAAADLSVDRVAAVTPEVGPGQPPVVTRPADPNKAVWKVELPTGTTAADWVVTAVTRQPRPKVEDPKHAGPFAVGPFAALDVLRQTGTVKVTAAPNTRFVFRHGPDLRRDAAPGPAEEDVTTAFFRLTTGPTGATPPVAPLFTAEARPQEGALRVKAAYRLARTDAGWRVRADVKVTPIRREVDAVTVEVPADWRGLEALPPELVEGVQPGVRAEGFWATSAARLAGELRSPVVVRLAAGQRQPFDLVLTATVPAAPGAGEAVIPLPRFPNAYEAEAGLVASVPEGFEVRGEAREWDGDAAAGWGTPLAPVGGAAGKSGRAVTSVTARGENGLARVSLAWHPHRPDLTADTRADVVVLDRHVWVTQYTRLRSAEGFAGPLRFRGPVAPVGLTARPSLGMVGAGEWAFTPETGARDAVLEVSYSVPLPPRAADDRGPWKVPVSLLWPLGVVKADTAARVWSYSATARTITTASGGWRDQPIEPVPDRDSLPPALRDTLPALTLAAPGTEVPLALEVREAIDPSAVGVWVDRGFVRAWAADDGGTEYHARFLIRQWHAPAVEVRIPGPPSAPAPRFLRDGQKVDPVPANDGGPDRGFRVPLPEPRPNRTVVVEVRYLLPGGRAGGESEYLPPRLPGAEFAGPVRWHVTVPDGSLPLLIGGARPELRWRPRPTGFGPVAAATADGMDRWFRTGDEGDAAGDTAPEVLTARQSSPAPLAIHRAPRAGFLVVCSVAAFLLVLLVVRLPVAAAGPAVAVLAGTLGAAAVFLPQPAAQVAGASQPGLVAVVGVYLAYASVRWNYRRRVTRLPGFARTRPEPSGAAPLPLPSPSRNRPAGVGTGSAPAPSAGG